VVANLQHSFGALEEFVVVLFFSFSCAFLRCVFGVGGGNCKHDAVVCVPFRPLCGG
jgi:hypothetical protein